MHLLWLKTISPEILGEVFETCVFAELIKAFGKDSIQYWRTKDKKEIDFIISIKNKIIPLETKVHFASFSKAKVSYLLNKYQPDNYYVVGLHGDKKGEHCLYPWEIKGTMDCTHQRKEH